MNEKLLIKDRLIDPIVTENALTVLKNRYLAKDHQGVIVEDPKDMYIRVASAVADAEQDDNTKALWANTFYEAMAMNLFMPNSPTIMNAGRKLGMLSACFPAGTSIETKDGPVAIEDITIRTQVLTHEGRYKSVQKVMTREGKLFRLKIDKLPELFVTEEHPILTARGWVQVKDLQQKIDFVKIGFLVEQPQSYYIDFEGKEVNGYKYQELAQSTANKQKREFSNQVLAIKAAIEINESIAWMLGLYISEGSISSGYDIRFTLSRDENLLATKLIDIISSQIGLEAKITTHDQPVGRKGAGWLTVRVHSKPFAIWLETQFSKGFNRKKLPAWVFSLTPKIAEAFLQGIADGDGTKINKSQTRITLSNENLVRQLFILAYKLGFNPNLTKEFMPSNATVNPWSISYGETYNTGMVKDGAYRVRSIEETDMITTVYNFEVEEDHSYVANQICVHNCFVIPVKDDLSDIFDSIKAVAMTQRAGGGTGFNFSNLRPSGSIVKSSGGTTAGPLSFIDVFSQATNTIQQGAFRRGANMGILDCNHPNIIDFIKAKSDLKRWQNYNISVAMTNDWMNGIFSNPTAQHEVQHKEWGTGYLYLNKNTNEIKAFKGQETPDNSWGPWTRQMTWDLICKRAWETGEPGLFFIDNANKNSPIPHVGRIESTNPCITGDTRILTSNGPISIAELTAGNCFACNGIGSIGQNGHNGNDIGCSLCDATGRADKKLIKLFAWDPDSKLPVIRNAFRPHMTAKYADIIEIEFDSGLKLRCTPNHNLRTFRGDKIEAKDLQIGQSVRAFSVSKHRDGHLRAHGYVGNRTVHQWIHRMVWEETNGEIPEGYIVHHNDGNPENNSLDNLQLMTSYAHQSEHYPERLANGFHHNKPKLEVCNHKVIDIRSAGKEDVYNIMVEDVHTYIIVDPSYRGDGPDGVWSGIVSQNCGEIPLHAWDSCNLGSINLGLLYTQNPNSIDNIDWDLFTSLISIGVRFLDNVITVNKHPLQEMEIMSNKTRRIGLGVMGWADLLFKLKIPYDSLKALELGEKMSKYLFNNATIASNKLAILKGNYGAYQGSNHEKANTPMRNAYVTTVAPTGTISIISNCSGGIEPLFALAFKRTVMPDANGKFEEMWEENEHWLNAIKHLNTDYKESIRAYAKNHGNIKNYRNISNSEASLPKIFVTSHDISPESHVRMQAAWQTSIDSAISKTINLAHYAPVEVVSEAYKLAYELNCVGITVYRDGCRNNVEGMKQPMAVNHNPALEAIPVNINEHTSVANKAADVYLAFRTQIKTQFGNLHVHVVLDPDTNKEREIFAQLGKAGDLIAADLEAICRLGSLSLKSGATIQEIIEQLKDIGTTHVMPTGDGKIVSMPDALAKALSKYLDHRESRITNVSIKKEKIESNYGLKCPACNIGRLSFQEGCQKCHSCGFSAC